MLDGQWIEIASEIIYYEYNTQTQYKKEQVYSVNPHLPINLSFDFNIGHGKPMSACLFQYDQAKDNFHIFAESVIEGARTADIIDDIDGRGLLPARLRYVINGDAAGKHKDTRSTRSDYDIIMKELSSRGLQYEYNVPAANPAIRLRHNRVNAYCKNDLGEVRLFLYKGCQKADEGLRLTQIKKGANYVEDDSKDYQHITTAIGYGICSTLDSISTKRQGTVQL